MSGKWINIVFGTAFLFAFAYTGIIKPCQDYHYRYNGQCIQCPDHCEICNSDTNCTDCSSNYYGSTCQQTCQLECKGVCQKEYGYCTHGCDDGTYLEPSTDSCPMCPSNCTLCTSAMECVVCHPGYHGTTCEYSLVSDDNVTSPDLQGILIPVLVVLMCVPLCLIALYIYWRKRVCVFYQSIWNTTRQETMLISISDIAMKTLRSGRREEDSEQGPMKDLNASMIGAVENVTRNASASSDGPKVADHTEPLKLASEIPVCTPLSSGNCDSYLRENDDTDFAVCGASSPLLGIRPRDLTEADLRQSQESIMYVKEALPPALGVGKTRIDDSDFRQSVTVDEALTQTSGAGHTGVLEPGFKPSEGSLASINDTPTPGIDKGHMEEDGYSFRPSEGNTSSVDKATSHAVEARNSGEEDFSVRESEANTLSNDEAITQALHAEHT